MSGVTSFAKVDFPRLLKTIYYRVILMLIRKAFHYFMINIINLYLYVKYRYIAYLFYKIIIFIKNIL